MSTSQIKIGVLATLLGPYAQMGQDGIRGVELAVAEYRDRFPDRPIFLVKEGTNAIPDSATSAAGKLLDEDQVDFIIGPLSGNEGLAMRDFAKTRPDRTFLNGTSATQDITLRSPAVNFFSFSTHGVQWMAGLGTYAYNTLGYRTVVTIAEDYSYPHGQVGAFLLEYKRAGGTIVKKIWVPLGTVDFSNVIAEIPRDVDAALIALGGEDGINFLRQCESVAGLPPLMGGASLTDQTVLGTKQRLSERFIGMVSAGPTADDNPNPAWQKFVHAYQTRYPRALPGPSLCAYGYYANTKAAMLALEGVGGNLSGGQARFQEVLAALSYESPTGLVRLDHNRQAIANNFIVIVDRRDDGTLYNKLVETIPAVDSTLGIPEVDYLALGPFGRDNPPT